jgi:uncharacterized LabA/DUF88 family protein
MKSLGVFVDVNNIYSCVNKRFEARKLDYQKYLSKTLSILPGSDYGLYRAFAYGTQLQDEASVFINALRHYGFEPKYRTPKHFDRKVDWNVGISMDVVRVMDKLDIVVLGSSNADLVPLIDWTKERGILCIVHACNIPKALRDSADRWIEITEDLLEDRSAIIKNDSSKTT